jgi:hypothetical protein
MFPLLTLFRTHLNSQPLQLLKQNTDIGDRSQLTHLLLQVPETHTAGAEFFERTNYSSASQSPSHPKQTTVFKVPSYYPTKDVAAVHRASNHIWHLLCLTSTAFYFCLKVGHIWTQISFLRAAARFILAPRCSVLNPTVDY